VIIVIFFAVVFLFLFFLGWLLSKEYTGGYRAIRRLRMGAFSMYSAHVQWYASYPLANYR
jgi:hypothetical protein